MPERATLHLHKRDKAGAGHYIAVAIDDRTDKGKQSGGGVHAGNAEIFKLHESDNKGAMAGVL